MKEYIHLPPEQAIPQMREDVHELLRAQSSGRVYNSDGTKTPNELFMLVRMVEYLLALVEQYQERIGT